MKLISLTQGKHATVSDEDYPALAKKSWAAHWNGKSWMAITNTGGGRANTRVITMHRFLMRPPDGMVVDHINHDTLDNRRENLRVCTYSQNNMNMRIRRDNTSGFKGVYFRRDRGTWRAEIRVNRKKRVIGTYKTKREAANAYDKAARELFGEYALTNREMGL